MKFEPKGRYFAPDGTLAVTWSGIRNAPFFEAPDPREGFLRLGGVEVNLPASNPGTTGAVRGLHMGYLTISSSNRALVGPYDGWALDVTTGYMVRWRGKTLVDTHAVLSFSDGCRVVMGRVTLGIPAALGPGAVRLEAVPRRNLGRTLRRALRVPGATLGSTGSMVVMAGSATAWPPETPLE